MRGNVNIEYLSTSQKWELFVVLFILKIYGKLLKEDNHNNTSKLEGAA